MEFSKEAESDELGFSIRRHVFLPLGILVGLFMLTLWGGFSYSGLLARMAEWQFSYFGEWYPMISVLSFCGLAVLLWRLFGWGRKRRLVAKKQWTPLDERKRRISLPHTSYATLLTLAGFCFALVMIGFLYWLSLPGSGSTAVLPKNNVVQLQEGPSNLTGSRAIGPISRYREAIFDIGPSQYFAPIAERKSRNGISEYYLFAELKMTKDGPRLANNRAGILRRAALPRELVVLYRSNGHAVADNPAVVFLTAASSGRATLVFMLEALAVGILCLIFALVMRRSYRKALAEIPT